MDIIQILSTSMPAATSVGAAVISVIAAVGSVLLAHLSSRSLETQKANYQELLERRKSELQAELEGRKLGLQKELEEVKAGFQQELEKQRAGYQEELERRKSGLQSELEGRKLILQKELEGYKAGISDELAAQNARRTYEYEAKRSLYVQVEPLLFRLFEAAEGAFHAVASLARSQRKGHLPEWLAPDADEYYIRSIIHRLFLPLAILRLIQRSTNLVDLSLDPSIRLRYAVLRQSYLTWTDDFEVANAAPELKYEPNEDDWAILRKQDQARYWRQGLVIGSVDRLVDAMTVGDSTPARPMNFGEWELAVEKNKQLKPAFDIVQDIFTGFEFKHRPVLGRILLSYACMMHALMSIYGKPVEQLDLTKLISDFSVAKDIRGLQWWDEGERDLIVDILPYVLKRCEQATHGGYSKF